MKYSASDRWLELGKINNGIFRSKSCWSRAADHDFGVIVEKILELKHNLHVDDHYRISQEQSCMSIVRSWSRSALRIVVHLTSEIVTKPPGKRCDALINSANASLVGTKLPYFPMQGCTILPPNSYWGWGREFNLE